ncbi:Clavaminate synthase-like protein [Decorospora gaudefroyi]|uniref:Clavaminate synthase-like protein n=1 Tax=Decorospora gaudefroyi TaxID=184978 RepID=A0A6A5KBY9_9PLEO|nr:Clavaminate synthase-like protein [Decorospora gaudefroyi]
MSWLSRLFNGAGRKPSWPSKLAPHITILSRHSSLARTHRSRIREGHTCAMNDNAPTLQEVVQLTRQELTIVQKTDSIRECGRAALSLLPDDAELGLKFAYQKLHDVPYREVKTCWRRLYTDASLWRVLKLAEGKHGQRLGGETWENTGVEWIDEVVRLLDMALILTGAPQREDVVELWFTALKAALIATGAQNGANTGTARPTKRRRLSTSGHTSNLPASFPTELPEPTPILRQPIGRRQALSLSAFQARVAVSQTHTPLVIEDAIDHWPALEERPWNSPSYLLEQMLGGRRLVPVEVGKSYTDEGWGQRIITFRDFIESYLFEENGAAVSLNDTLQSKGTKQARPIGYLAQHDLFAQIPSLRADISIPDYCYCEPAPSPHLTHIKPVEKLEEPLLNAWFGPAGTISPLHTDPYHNILAQVVGYKYVRLYAPEETERLYPRSIDKNGVDMSNTSQVDLDEAMAVHPAISCCNAKGGTEGDEAVFYQQRREFQDRFPLFKDAKYVEGILGPGDCLYLPVGWWHYIKSLTPSFSVSFWFN